MVRPAFDETLADLANITVSVNHPTIRATREKPVLATITIEAATLQAILTAASLHMSDNPFVPKPEVGEYAEGVAESNAQNQDWHWEMEDVIGVLGGRLSNACSPDYPDRGIHNEPSVARNRKHRELFAKMDKEEREKAEASDPTTVEGLTARFDAMNIKPLADRDVLKLLTTLLNGTTPSIETASQLFERWRKDSGDLEKARKRIAAVVSAAQGF